MLAGQCAAQQLRARNLDQDVLGGVYQALS